MSTSYGLYGIASDDGSYPGQRASRPQPARPLICPTGNQAQQLLRASGPLPWNSL
jgi:hypothetical protein